MAAFTQVRHSMTRAMLLFLVVGFSAYAAEHHGQVRFGQVPVAGAVVVATQGDKTLRTVTDPQGNYTFNDMQDGAWTMDVEMLGFAPIHRELTITPNAPAAAWELQVLPMSVLKTEPAPGFLSTGPALRFGTSA